MRCLLLADIVAKVQNRTTQKISRKSRRLTQNASAALRIFVRHPKKAFSTISAQSGHQVDAGSAVNHLSLWFFGLTHWLFFCGHFALPFIREALCLTSPFPAAKFARSLNGSKSGHRIVGVERTKEGSVCGG